MQRNQALDGFRGLGCLLVMLGHTQWGGVTVLPGAVIAMDLFFVLSGFLITGLLISEWNKTQRIQLLQFWKRRAIRLLPAFYVYFFIGATVFLLSRFQPIVGDNALYTLVSTGLYFSNWVVAQGYNLGIFFVTWSLSLEEQFYAVAPVLMLLLFRRFSFKKIILILAAAVLLVNLHRYRLFHELLETQGLAAAWKRCFYGLDTRADALMIGSLAAFVWSTFRDRLRIPGFLALIANVGFFGSLAIRDLPIAYRISENSLFTEFLMSGGFSMYSVFGVIMILHLLQEPKSWLAKVLTQPVFVHLGVISYSTYLYHTTVFGGLDIILKSMDANAVLWALKTLIKFSVAIGLGYVSYRWVEMKVIQKLSAQKKFSSIP